MRKLRFTVIYIENEQLKHKQINAYNAQLACEDFKKLNPNAIVLEAGIGPINKEAWTEMKAHKKEVIKDEMIKDMSKIVREYVANKTEGEDKHCVYIVGKCHDNVLFATHNAGVSKALYNAGYRKVADDEIVVKKSEYKELKKYRTDWLNSEKMHLQAELEDTEFELDCSNRLFQKVCEEKKELEKQLEQTKQETREILQELKDRQTFMLADEVFGRETVVTRKINELAEKYGIELED